ncbi:MAG: preprotein translocase subunit SecE [Proteobacteria bacterium]|jgi:preprotein translocase subunit SecE|nr:preprotein translocase subunit SecE [Alphaproteobacteria bacterium]NCC02423.1 preprotein translocase subunit SecE [Pseudomonadota bacterium]
MASLIKFIQETRGEVKKVTWPTQKETTMTTALVVGMALLAGVFFFIVDNMLGYIISSILGMRS